MTVETHFIEMYQVKSIFANSDVIGQTTVLPLELLEDSILSSKGYNNLETIAIFKIKAK